MDTFDAIPWLRPWQPTTEPELITELHNEVAPAHPLYQQQAIAVARRCDDDDVLFYLPTSTSPYAVVHLTWSGKPERADWPHTILYASLDDWIERCMLTDHEAYCGER